jgi:hypothetical protein
MPVPPTHRVSFADSDSIGSIAYSADSREIYVALTVETISLWRVILNEWPYTIGLLSVIVMLLGAVLLRRVLARPRRTGRMYCRKCNHEIADRSVPCQECGRAVEQRRALVRGYARWKRLAPGLVLVVVPMVIYGVLWVTPNSFYAPMWDWFDLWSNDTLAFANKHRIGWLYAQRDNAIRIVVVDADSGVPMRELGTFRNNHGTWVDLSLTISPDGTELYLPDRDFKDLIGISTRTGRILHRFRHGGASQVTQVAGISADGAIVYGVFQDLSTNDTSLVRRDKRSGSQSVITSVKGMQYPPGSRRPARFHLVSDGPDPEFLLLPARASIVAETMPLMTSAEQVIDVFRESDPDHPSRVRDTITFGTPFIRSDGKIVLQTQAEGIDLIDARKGIITPLLRAGALKMMSPFALIMEHIALGSETYRELAFFDLSTGAPVPEYFAPRLQLNMVEPISMLTASPDLTSIAAVTLVDTGGYPRRRDELLIYDLTPYPKLRELEFGEEKK